jgi:uncharacterized DUF497 family protein
MRKIHLRLGTYAFTWRPKKAAGNLRKHGVAFAEAAYAFLDIHGIVQLDLTHPEREILIGYSNLQRLLTTVHIELDEMREAGEIITVIHIVSAWRTSRSERAIYERKGERLDPSRASSTRVRRSAPWIRNPYAASIRRTGIRVLPSALPRAGSKPKGPPPLGYRWNPHAAKIRKHGYILPTRGY